MVIFNSYVRNYQAGYIPNVGQEKATGTSIGPGAPVIPVMESSMIPSQDIPRVFTPAMFVV